MRRFEDLEILQPEQRAYEISLFTKCDVKFKDTVRKPGILHKGEARFQIETLPTQVLLDMTIVGLKFPSRRIKRDGL